MASIVATKNEEEGRRGFEWNFTHADTPVAVEVEGGDYTISVEGTFGGASIEMHYGLTAATVHSVDATLLTFTSNKSYNMRMGRGFLVPVRTGGAAATIKVKAIPIPTR